ncbi:hypothetical protein Tco_0680072 [Tanacetum coccineum]|uniref:Reverse transcriptase zinc-binding domain-containing protein n=1 Tax=Tanacetum coccineum TaxID=301880 RepID=A0ABQ4XKN4_9ASTR
MKQWDVGPIIDVNSLHCSLCNAQLDSHTHLFFECAFSAKVWSYVRVLADMDLVPPVMHDITLYLQPIGSKRMARCIFGKLIVAAATYFIWLERNNRTFKNVRRSPEEIRDIIMVTVRLKLLSLHVVDGVDNLWSLMAYIMQIVGYGGVVSSKWSEPYCRFLLMMIFSFGGQSGGLVLLPWLHEGSNVYVCGNITHHGNKEPSVLYDYLGCSWCDCLMIIVVRWVRGEVGSKP